VLLNVAETNACPCGTNFLSRRRVRNLLGILCFDSASGRVNHWPVPSAVRDGILESGDPESGPQRADYDKWPSGLPSSCWRLHAADRAWSWH
jgi:hypothetical protein